MSQPQSSGRPRPHANTTPYTPKCEEPLYERLGVVAGHMENLGKHLTKTVDFYNKTVSSMESRLLTSARSVSALEEASKKTMTVAPIDPDAAQVRTFTKPELTDQ